MKKFAVIAAILAAAWYGNVLYRRNALPFFQEHMFGLKLGEQEKCITKDGGVLYGEIPEGTTCEHREQVRGSLTIVPNETLTPNNGNFRGASSFACDGRQYCSQMSSRAEAEFFLRNCPNTKMDGDQDGIPCEHDSRF